MLAAQTELNPTMDVETAFNSYLEAENTFSEKYMSANAVMLEDNLDEIGDISQNDFKIADLCEVNDKFRDFVLHRGNIQELQAIEMRKMGYVGLSFVKSYYEEARANIPAGATDGDLELYGIKLRQEVDSARKTYQQALESLYSTLSEENNSFEIPNIQKFLEILGQPEYYFNRENLLRELNGSKLRMIGAAGIQFYLFLDDNISVSSISNELEITKIKKIIDVIGIDKTIPIILDSRRDNIWRSHCSPEGILINPNKDLLTDEEENIFQHEITHWLLRERDKRHSYSRTVEEGIAVILPKIINSDTNLVKISDSLIKAMDYENSIFQCTEGGTNVVTHTQELRAIGRESDINRQSGQDKAYFHGALLIEFINNEMGGLEKVLELHELTSAQDIKDETDGGWLVSNGLEGEKFTENKIIEIALIKMGFNYDDFKDRYFEYKRKRLEDIEIEERDSNIIQPVTTIL